MKTPLNHILPFLSTLTPLAALLRGVVACVSSIQADPFDPGQQALPEIGPVTKILQKVLERVRFDLKVEPAKVKRGDVIHVSVSGTPMKGFFAYPINVKTPKQDSLIPAFKYSGIDGIKPLWPIKEIAGPKARTFDGWPVRVSPRRAVHVDSGCLG